MIDTHSHIDMLKNPPLAIKESKEAGVDVIIVPSSSPDNFGAVLNLANSYPMLFGALGVHPEDVLKYEENTPKDIYNLVSQNPKVIAIGEIGLDYYWDRTNIKKQTEIFKSQLEIALCLDLPVLIHDREAHEDTFNIMKGLNIKKAVMHCFSGSIDFAQKCINEGWLLGIGGVLTFKNSKKIKEVVKSVPLESIVLETDAPYLTPHPFRGEENSPKYLKFIAKEIANLKDTTTEHVDIVTTQTAKNFFNIKGDE
ncbi:MAG: TatD family hydrolase [Candidatus Gastranaerophilales bacterium]|nr:TatD family hydrolase [Candidatus Gastranaerophilales bacterium]